MNMKNSYALLLLLKFSLAVNADLLTNPEEGEARLAYYTTTGDGSSFMTFNGTSMQNVVVLGVILVVLGSLLLPYYGITNGILGLFEAEPNTNKNDFTGIPIPNINTNLGYGTYQTISKRSSESMEPVWKAIMESHKKYK